MRVSRRHDDGLMGRASVGLAKMGSRLLGSPARKNDTWSLVADSLVTDHGFGAARSAHRREPSSTAMRQTTDTTLRSVSGATPVGPSSIKSQVQPRGVPLTSRLRRVLARSETAGYPHKDPC